MPRITDERRAARREQVLEAARACLQEHGLEAVSMEMIIARSGLSTGAVYGYFKGKDDIISAVVTEGTAAMGRQLVPILKDPEPRPLPELMEQLLRTIADFGQDKHDGIDRLLVALHGWSHSQSDPGPGGHPRRLPQPARTARRHGETVAGGRDARPRRRP
jgi:AcrR family transcriptional regulator